MRMSACMRKLQNCEGERVCVCVRVVVSASASLCLCGRVHVHVPVPVHVHVCLFKCIFMCDTHSLT